MSDLKLGEQVAMKFYALSAEILSDRQITPIDGLVVV